MKLTKQSKIDFSLCIGSVLVLSYVVFMNYAAQRIDWHTSSWLEIMDLITIPVILMACAIPIVVVFRFISKKTTNRTIAILTLFFSLIIALLLGSITV